MASHERYKKAWYDKKLKQNKRIINFLLEKIDQHKEPDFPWTTDELRTLKYEDIAEIAVACVNKQLLLTLGSNQDYHDGSDTKCAVSQYRNNMKSKNGKKASWQHSYMVSGTKNKAGALRIVAYNSIKDEFEFFYIPAGHFDTSKRFIEIVIEVYRLDDGVQPNFTGNPSGKYKWLKYKKASFEEMANCMD